MFGSDLLDIGIGTALVFLFMSLIATALREGIEAILKTRARDLEVGLRELLDDPTGKTVTKDIYDHPMIYALFLGRYDPVGLTRGKDLTGGRRMWWFRSRNLPAYIPSAQFAEALLDWVAKGAVDTAPVASAVWKQLSIDGLRASVAKLENKRLQRALGVAIDQAQGDIAKVKSNIEAWFNSAMDRVSGWYRARSQVVLFLLGLGAAVTFNVDALEVIQHLTYDKNLRAAAVGYAERIAPSDSAPDPGQDAGPKGLPADLQKATFAEVRKQIDEIGYPIGWSPRIPQWDDRACPPADAAGRRGDCTRAPDWWIRTKMALGWFITALAVTLGAPFWFDILNRFMIVRSTVKPREKSRDEGGKDGGADSSNGGTDAPSSDGNGPRSAAVGGPLPSFALLADSSNPTAFVPHEWAGAADKQEGRI